MDPLAQRLLMAAAGKPSYPLWALVGTVAAPNIARGVSVGFPPGTQAGDAVIVLAIGAGTSGTHNLPGGNWEWLKTRNTTIRAHSIQMLRSVAAETSWLNDNGGSPCNILLMAFRPLGFNRSLIKFSFAIASSGQFAQPGLPDPPALTTTTSQNTLVAMGFAAGTGAITGAPSGFSGFASSTDATNSSIVFAATSWQRSAGLSDPGAFPGDTTMNAACYQIVLRTEPVTQAAITSAFADGSTYAQGTVVTSETKTVTVEKGPASISISGGSSAQYAINGGAWTSAAGLVSDGDSVQLRQTSGAGSPGVNGVATATLTLASATYPWNLQTIRELVVVGTSSADTVVSFTVPAGVTSLSVVGTGAGGPGGDSNSVYSGSTLQYTCSGGSGGGGAMSRTPALAVSAGQILSVTAGGGQAYGSGLAGNDSSILRSGTTLWRAKGGSAGANAVGTTRGLGGAGGSATNSVGTTKYAGGAGGNGVYLAGSNFQNYAFPGGGGAGGYTGAGGTGSAASTSAFVASGAGAGGAASGGSNGGSGGGTGVSGAGTSGASVSGLSGGQEGSSDGIATAGGWMGAGGVSGGGGTSRTSQPSGPGAVRIVW